MVVVVDVVVVDVEVVRKLRRNSDCTSVQAHSPIACKKTLNLTLDTQNGNATTVFATCPTIMVDFGCGIPGNGMVVLLTPGQMGWGDQGGFTYPGTHEIRAQRLVWQYRSPLDLFTLFLFLSARIRQYAGPNRTRASSSGSRYFWKL
ncbi:hypothetical protein N7509_000016 [Penicillium cosmopolitanum]|uniref:Uncharacterized protein n=1 Tax=Penicillium cosmopolitanum TaxID=1131564 RepID=A0A9X0BFA6_9EURO|nr:uncharacterized protein N7509_000016 [Penicillium cosmopolitanum]KAJ5414918.1 hypothetical protein N7509_000016 [Penicillium cosmopolitanum]